MSLKLKIYEAIKQVYPKPYPIDEVFGIADLLGHKQSLAERKCRELVHSGLMSAVKNDKGYNVAYKWIKPIHPVEAIELKAFNNLQQDKLFEVRIPLD